MSSSGGKSRSKRASQPSATGSKTNAHACSKVVHVLQHALFPLLEHGPLLPAEAAEDDNVGKELLLNLQRRESTPIPAEKEETSPLLEPVLQEEDEALTPASRPSQSS